MTEVRRNGFTLAETIVALVVVAMVVTLWSGLMNGAHRLGRADQERPLDWYLFASELESRDHHFFVRPGRRSNQLVLTSRVTHEDYELVAGPVVYLRRVAAGGYMPLLRMRPGERFTWQQVDDHRVRFQLKGGTQNEEVVVAFEPPTSQQSVSGPAGPRTDQRGGRGD